MIQGKIRVTHDVAMTEAELLAANGNKWKVQCYEGGNRRKCHRILYVRAETRQRACEVARAVYGERYTLSYPWNPLEDGVMGKMVQLVP